MITLLQLASTLDTQLYNALATFSERRIVVLTANRSKSYNNVVAVVHGIWHISMAYGTFLKNINN